MAVYRNIHISFWQDTKIIDDFEVEDRYFYLYILTNPHTKLCGCYEISIKQMANELGFIQEKVRTLIDRFESKFNVIRYNEPTKELLILNWHKYNWTKSAKVDSALKKEFCFIKCKGFRHYLEDVRKDRDTVYDNNKYPIDANATTQRHPIDTVSNKETCPIDTDTKLPSIDTDSDTDIVSVSDTDTDNKLENIKDIVDYLNFRCGTNYRYQTDNTQRHIKARFADGYTLDDFKVVIDKKADEWMNTEHEKYLRPETLFGPKFESYLNQKIIPRTKQKAPSGHTGVADFLNVAAMFDDGEESYGSYDKTRDSPAFGGY